MTGRTMRKRYLLRGIYDNLVKLKRQHSTDGDPADCQSILSAMQVLVDELNSEYSTEIYAPSHSGFENFRTETAALLGISR